MSGEGGSIRQIAYLAGLAIVFIAIRPFQNLQILTSLPATIYTVIIWCAISIIWSIAPDISVRRLFLTVTVIWIVFKSVEHNGYEQVLNTVCYACVALLIANYIAIATSSAAYHHEGDMLGDPGLSGSWRGVLPHKNGTGPLCAYTIMLLMFGFGRFKLFWRLVLIAAAAFFLVKTQSKTSISLSLVGLACGRLFMFYNPRYRIVLIPLSILALAGLEYAWFEYLPGYLDQLASSTDAFTGRIQIWRVMAAYLKDHPYFGTGFGAFWNVPSGPVGLYASSGWIKDQVAEGHNGYLDIWTQIGLVGLVLSVFAVFVVPISKLLFSLHAPRTAGGLQICVLVFAIGHNFTESSLFATDQFMQVVILLAVACTENMRKAVPVRKTQRSRQQASDATPGAVVTPDMPVQSPLAEVPVPTASAEPRPAEKTFSSIVSMGGSTFRYGKNSRL